METTLKQATIITQFQYLINKINTLPLWVKQAIYCELKSNIAECSDIDFLDKLDAKVIQLLKPEITLNAMRYSIRCGNLERNESYFLNDAEKELNLLEIAHKNGWNFKETCIILLSLIEKRLIEPIDDEDSLNFILYITEKIRLGEFLLRNEKLTSLQLDKALYTMKCARQIGEDISFKEILVNLGYIKKKDIEKITSIKDSSLTSVSIIDETMSQSEEIICLQDQLDALIYEKKKLEEKILFYQKEIDETSHENRELMKQSEKYSKGFMGKFLTSLS